MLIKLICPSCGNRVKEEWSVLFKGYYVYPCPNCYACKNDIDKAAQSVVSDLLPCGHHRDAIIGGGREQWCVACEAENR